MTDDTTTPGRPTELDGGRRVQVYLDTLSLEFAVWLGEGNLSRGIRSALERVRKQETTEEN